MASSLPCAAVSGLIVVPQSTQGRPDSTARIAHGSCEAATVAHLMRCMPAVPCGYSDDFGFRQRYLDHALPVLEWRCVAIMLGSASHDEAHAAELVDVLTECAIAIAGDCCAPDFAEEGFLEVGAVLSFIEIWRENVASGLALVTVESKG